MHFKPLKETAIYYHARRPPEDKYRGATRPLWYIVRSDVIRRPIFNRAKNMPQSAPRPRRGRTRKLRSVAAAAAPPPYITRALPPYDLLEEEGLERIERHADAILSEFGIEIRGDPEALDLFQQAGAERNGERLTFEPGLVKHLVQRSTPGEFIHLARNPARSVRVGGPHVALAPAYGSPFVRDLDGGRRYGTLEDFRNLVKLACLNPAIHYSGGTICEPCDVAVNKRHLDMVYAHMRWSDKPFMGSVTTAERARESIDMCRILFGADTVDTNCVILGNINVNSPLVYDGEVTRVTRTDAEAGQGGVVCPFSLGGAMGPVTPAAAIAQAHAEAMVGVALTQLVRPGAPVIYGNFLTTMSLRSGAPTFGQPEAMLAYMAVGQLGRRIGIPLRCGGAFTSSKISDAQAAQESAQSLLPALLSGANFVLHAAGWLEGGLTMGYEKFIQDADRCAMMAKLFAGLPLGADHFALDAYRETAHGEHFLGAAHTLRHYAGVFEATTADSNSYEQWLEQGQLTDEQRAHRIWKTQLAEYRPPAIDTAVDQALREYIDRVKGSRADRWY